MTNKNSIPLEFLSDFIECQKYVDKILTGRNGGLETPMSLEEATDLLYSEMKSVTAEKRIVALNILKEKYNNQTTTNESLKFIRD